MFEYEFPMTSTTVTLVVVDSDNSRVLLGKRASNVHMFPDWWSLPGGFLDAKNPNYPGEITEQTCARELLEEANINITNISRFKLFGVNSDPEDDPRAHVVNLWYYISITDEEAKSAAAGDDIQELRWLDIPLRTSEYPELAFNHKVILHDGLNLDYRMSSKRYKEFATDNSVALAVMRIQPLHNGHTRLINQMISDHDIVIIGIGSSNQEVSDRNPWTFDERKAMLRRIYGSRIKIVQLSDIGAEEDSNTWCDYVLDKINKLGLPKPEHYYTGSKADASWYEGRFENNITILERTESNFISGSDIRRLIQVNNPTWKEYTPKVNHPLIYSTYPEVLKIIN